MSDQVKRINAFFRLADRQDINEITSRILLTERQKVIFEMKYIKGHDINFIADTLGCCSRVVQKELRHIRIKIAKALDI